MLAFWQQLTNDNFSCACGAMIRHCISTCIGFVEYKNFKKNYYKKIVEFFAFLESIFSFKISLRTFTSTNGLKSSFCKILYGYTCRQILQLPYRSKFDQSAHTIYNIPVSAI